MQCTVTVYLPRSGLTQVRSAVSFVIACEVLEYSSRRIHVNVENPSEASSESHIDS